MSESQAAGMILGGIVLALLLADALIGAAEKIRGGDEQ